MRRPHACCFDRREAITPQMMTSSLVDSTCARFPRSSHLTFLHLAIHLFLCQIAAMRPSLRLLTRKANYPGHIPLSPAQNALLAVGSGVVGVLDVTRGDLIASLSESTAGIFLPALHGKMNMTPEGRQIMKDRPEITNKTIEKLKELKRGTLGREYIEWLGDGGLEPESRAPVSLLIHSAYGTDWS